MVTTETKEQANLEYFDKMSQGMRTILNVKRKLQYSTYKRIGDMLYEPHLLG